MNSRSTPEFTPPRSSQRWEPPEWLPIDLRLNADGHFPGGPLPFGCRYVLLSVGTLHAAEILPIALYAEQVDRAGAGWLAVAPAWLAPFVDCKPVSADTARRLVARLAPLGVAGRRALAEAYAVGGDAAFAAVLDALPAGGNTRA